MSIDTYDPGLLIFIFNGFSIGGFMDGTFITVERAEDTWMDHVGADGEYARVRNRNKSGTIKFTLMQTATANDYLSSQIIIDERTGGGTGAALIQDGGGRTLVNGADCYVLRPATIEFAKGEILGREWTLKVPQLDVFIGGSGLT